MLSSPSLLVDSGSFMFCEFEGCCFFFASDVDDMKRTRNRMVRVQLLSHVHQNGVSTPPHLRIRKHFKCADSS